MPLVNFISDVPADQLRAGYRRFYNGTGSTIAAGTAVARDFSIATTVCPLGSAIKPIIASGTQANGGGGVGGAHESIPTGTWGLVQVQGLDLDVAMDSGATLGAYVIAGTTAGRVLGSTSADQGLGVVAVVVAANVGGVIWSTGVQPEEI